MTDIELLRHTVATLAYRAAKAIRDAPQSFTHFKPGPTSKTPVEILAHMGDLFDWALTLIQGDGKWRTAVPLPWDQECVRFFASLQKFDQALANQPSQMDIAKIFQGPIADALTHTGQLTMLRRLAGCPMKGEAYPAADIVMGRVGFQQTPADPKFEFV